MAGIIFLLEKRIKHPSLSRSVLTEAGDSFEAIGPWFLTVLSLVVMGLGVYLITGQAPVLFYLLITYATAISLIISSPIHTMFTRYLADEIFVGKYHVVINGLMALSALALVLTFGVSAFLVFAFSTIALNLKISFVGLTTLLSLLWCISSAFSALQKKRLLFKFFALGVSFGLLLFLIIRPRAPQVLLLIFSLGVGVPTAAGYAYLIKLYLRENIFFDWTFIKLPGALKLGASLFIFTLGFWADKIIFWFSRETGSRYDPLFHFSAYYDFPFFAAITIMMVGSLLVYKGMKRRITGPYESFVYKLFNNFPFRELSLEKFRLVQGIGHVSSSIFLIYGGICILILFFLYFRAIPFPWQNPFVFHYLLLGSIFFSLYFFYFLVLQYLDDFGILLKLNTIFFSTNVAFTLFSIKLGWQYYGAGFMLASVFSSFTAFVMVNSRVGGLEFEVFRKALRQQKRSERIMKEHRDEQQDKKEE